MFQEIINVLQNNREIIISLLCEIENYEEAKTEIELSISALKNSNKYIERKANRLCAYFPMNLPLYSLITYSIIPRICVNECYYRPSTKTSAISKRIHEILNLEKYNIHLINKTRKDYLQNLVIDADIVVFTGKPENAKKIEDSLKKDTMFIYFGVGQNPIVVEKDANLELASKKTVNSVLFNYGQDCAKPNIILVNSKVYNQFLELIIHEISKKNNSKTSIKDLTIFKKLTDLILSERNNIVLGGSIDFKNITLDPIVIGKELKVTNDVFDEYYAPIFRIYHYNNVSDLKNYFFDPIYKKENMNISLFGTSEYIDSLPNSIVLYNETVEDLDNGVNEFGGFGNNVSYVKYNGLIVNKPILINREIQEFFKNSNFENSNNKGKPGKAFKLYLYKEFEQNILRLFENNLVFSFIFGSHAKFCNKTTSDIDMLVCIRDKNLKQIEDFRYWYFKYHYVNGIIPDKIYPGEIITEEDLRHIIFENSEVEFKLNNSAEVFDSIFYVQILSDKKINILGNAEKLHEFENTVKQNIKSWCNQIFELLQKENQITSEREYMKCLMALEKNDLLFFSKKLNYDENICEYDNLIGELDDGLFRKILKYK